MKPLSPIKGREPVFFALFAGGNHVEPLALQDEGKDGAATSRKLDWGGYLVAFWPSAARPSGFVAWTGGAGARHGIDVERLFNHVGGVGWIVLREPVFDAADAVVGRGGLGDYRLEGRKVVGEGTGKIVGAGGGRAIVDGIGGGERKRAEARRSDIGGGEGKHRGLGRGGAADAKAKALGKGV